jgi:hypothetical protein
MTYLNHTFLHLTQAIYIWLQWIRQCIVLWYNRQLFSWPMW